ncbi:MAG: VIT1/CCC1 transporter family protein [Candidatus Aenigmarchaeota archaeon]|nr:VIT1/CCC1 transporter family protein [Candidatus Aenigmarchaeota archaeon]
MHSSEMQKKLLVLQQAEITEHVLYHRLSYFAKEGYNKKILEGIASDELKHYEFWKKYTKRDIGPKRLSIWFYLVIVTIFGLTFGLRMMERVESHAQNTFLKVAKSVPGAVWILHNEEKHEHELVGMLQEERLQYVGSIVLGINDALVELTGMLAGLTFVLRDPRLIAITGLVTGIAAALSMAASEYLSTKTEANVKKPFRAALYTGTVYMITVLLLISPYFAFGNVLHSLMVTLLLGIFIIFIFTFYVSVAKDLPFVKRFLEMIAISLGVAAISFVIGSVITPMITGVAA